MPNMVICLHIFTITEKAWQPLQLVENMVQNEGFISMHFSNSKRKPGNGRNILMGIGERQCPNQKSQYLVFSSALSGCLSVAFSIEIVELLFYVHGKHLRSCRDSQLT